MPPRAIVAGLLFATALSAQNLVPNGEFHDGPAGWTLTAFNDPLGSTGFASARVANQGPSMAVFADFQTLTSVMSATFQSPQVQLPAGPLPVGFRVMWEKQVTTPIPSPTVNRVELRILDASNVVVYTGTRAAPNQTGLLERAEFTAAPTIPAAGNYSFVLFLRHSNLAGIPFRCWVDDVYCGSLATEHFGQGCVGSGGFVPVIGSSNPPAVNSANFTVELNDAFAPTVAVFLVDLQNTSWAGGPLPFGFGGGCNLLVGGAATLFLPMLSNGAGTGTASQVIGIPNFPGLAGLTLYSQWGVLDPAAQNQYSAVTSAGYRITIQ